MKISMFHLMPYRDLPHDFEKRYHSVWVDPPFHELSIAPHLVVQLNRLRGKLVIFRPPLSHLEEQFRQPRQQLFGFLSRELPGRHPNYCSAALRSA